jgi:hypothetical protein
VQGSVIDDTLTNWTPEEGLAADDRILSLSLRIQEGAARVTEINLGSDQLRVIDHWVQAGQTALVGIPVVRAGQQIEYWLRIQVQPIANESLEACLNHDKVQWFEELSARARMIAQYFQEDNIECVFRMRYQDNTLRMWFARRD